MIVKNKKELEKFFGLRSDSLTISETNEKFNLGFSKIVRLFRFGTILFLILGLGELKNGINPLFIFGILAFFMFFFMEKSIKIKLEKHQKNDTNIDDWLHKQGRKKLLFQIFFVISFTALFSSFNVYISQSLFLPLTIGTCFGLYLLMIYITSLKPKLFFSSLWNGIATILFFLNVIFIFSFLIIQLQNIPEWFKIFSYIVVSFLGILVVVGIILMAKESKLNFFQEEVLSFIRPQELYIPLLKSEELFELKKDVFKILDKKFRKDDRKKEMVLLSILLEKYHKTEKKYVGYLIGFLLFSAGAFGSNILNDIIYLPYIKPILCSIDLAICK